MLSGVDAALAAYDLFDVAGLVFEKETESFSSVNVKETVFKETKGKLAKKASVPAATPKSKTKSVTKKSDKEIAVENACAAIVQSCGSFQEYFLFI